MSEAPKMDIAMDRDNLYREESYTDLKTGSIRRLIPVKADGSPDPSRKALYSGHTQILSQMGPVPVSSVIEAENLEEALARFPDAVQAAVEQMIEEAKELQRREAGRIVVPGAEARSKLHLG